MQTITFMLIDNTIDDPKYPFFIAIGYKGLCNNKSDKFCISRFNKTCSSCNKFNLYYKITKKYIKVSIYLIAIVLDAMEKWSYANYSGGNSTFSTLYRISYNTKDIENILPLH